MATEPQHEHEQNQEQKAANEGVPEGDLIYRSVRQDGEHALSLPTADLMWSGLAAGMSMAFSLVAEGLLRAHLPDAAWTPLVTKFGYAAGFLIVILGRQQLFTEQTLTAILPMLARRPQGSLSNVARLWVVVLAANILGTAIAAGAMAWTTVFPHEVHAALSHIGGAAMSHGWGTTFVRGIFAGYLIAVMIWLLPGAEAARIWIVLLLTYLVGLGAFSHIIAGSAECLYMVFTGQRSMLDYFAVFFAPTLAGNAIGGVMLVASLAHAQHGD